MQLVAVLWDRSLSGWVQVHEQPERRRAEIHRFANKASDVWCQTNDESEPQRGGWEQNWSRWKMAFRVGTSEDGFHEDSRSRWAALGGYFLVIPLSSPLVL